MEAVEYYFHDLTHTTFRFYLIDFQLNTDLFPFLILRFYRKIT